MCALTLSLVLLGGIIVEMFYGADFRGNGYVVGIIAFGAPLWAASAVLSGGLRAINHPDADFRARVAGFLVTFSMSVLTVSKWGMRDHR